MQSKLLSWFSVQSWVVHKFDQLLNSVLRSSRIDLKNGSLQSDQCNLGTNARRYRVSKLVWEIFWYSVSFPFFLLPFLRKKKNDPFWNVKCFRAIPIENETKIRKSLAHFVASSSRFKNKNLSMMFSDWDHFFAGHRPFRAFQNFSLRYLFIVYLIYLPF